MKCTDLWQIWYRYDAEKPVALCFDAGIANSLFRNSDNYFEVAPGQMPKISQFASYAKGIKAYTIKIANGK